QRLDRVEGRAGYVHEQDLGLDGDGAGDAQSLLLPAGQSGAGKVEAVLDLVPQVRAAQGTLSEVVGLRLRQTLVVQSHTCEHVLLDAHGGERVGALEHHADLAADVDGVDARAVDVSAVHEHLAGDAGSGDDLVHAVECAQHCGFAAARGADERGHGPGPDLHFHAVDGSEVAVEDVEILDVDLLGHCVSLSSGP